MDNGTTESAWLHSIRQELRTSRRRQINALEARLAELRCQEKATDFAEYRRQELERIERHKARFLGEALTITVEDAIFTRLVDAEELLTVVVGLFTELSEDKDNWLLAHKADIVRARSVLHNAIHDISFAE